MGRESFGMAVEGIIELTELIRLIKLIGTGKIGGDERGVLFFRPREDGG